MHDRVADWHGDKAAAAYARWSRTDEENDLREFCRHTAIADRLRRPATVRRAA